MGCGVGFLMLALLYFMLFYILFILCPLLGFRFGGRIVWDGI